jgi:hypothetical protein
MVDFPLNIIADYTTRLANPIYLEGFWEVGLVEIIYPTSILNDISGEISIRSILDSGKQTERYGEPVGFNLPYDPDETFSSLKNKIMRFYDARRISIRFDENDKSKMTRIFFTPGTVHEIRLEPRLASVLGFPTFLYTNLDYAREIKSNLPEQYVEIGELFLYTDIISHEYIGDVKAKVLRIVGMDSSTNKQVSKLYDNPHYVPLERNNIDTVQIQIKDKTGRIVRFKSGTVIVKLHFRKKFF